jgi:hypothetical protein
LINLYEQSDQNIAAVWEVYSILNDSKDMLESLKVILIVLKKKQQQAVKQPTA